MADQQPNRSRLLPILLGGFAFFCVTTILLAGYLFLNYWDLREREASLLAREDLQRQLFKNTAPDHALYPHMYSDIGYVLNPFLPEGTATMWAGDHVYPVNSIGLRGREIEPVRPGVKRIVLVGDSRFFGWKLSDSERLEAALGDALARVAPDVPFEVVTVALPGWNIEAQAGFLEKHIQTLTPDYVVWSILPNDFQETFGTLTDGSPAGFYSRQIPDGPRQGKMGRPVRFLPMPAVVARWHSSFARLRDVVGRYGFPLLIVNWDFSGEWYESMGELPYPVLHIPRKLWEQDTWAVETGDRHPSAFAHTQIAVAVAASLAEMGAFQAPRFSEAERGILADFGVGAPPHYSADEIEAYFQEVAESIPTGIWKDEPNPASIYFGLQRPQYVDMKERGIVYLRIPEGKRAIKLSIVVPSEWLDESEKNLRVTLRNRAGQSIEKLMPLSQSNLRFEIELGRLVEDYPVVEIEWKFDYVQCRRPDRCAAAWVRSIRSID